MFTLFLQLFVVRSFVGEPEPMRRQASVKRLTGATNRTPTWLMIGWAAIAAKCVAVWWLIEKYRVPIHPLWLVGPTILFGLLATSVYMWRK